MKVHLGSFNMDTGIVYIYRHKDRSIFEELGFDTIRIINFYKLIFLTTHYANFGLKIYRKC